MVLLATVTLAGAIVAAGVALLGSAPASQPAYLADSTPVRIIGAPFAPNTNPRERH
jgi:hypothetical protein